MGKGVTRRRFSGRHLGSRPRARTIHPTERSLGPHTSSQVGRGMACGGRPCQNFRKSRATISGTHNDGWSLVLSLRRSRKTGELEPNPDRPRIRITSKDSKSAFFSLMRPRIPEEWPVARFLDLHTLAFALHSNSFSQRFSGQPGPRDPVGDGRAVSEFVNHPPHPFGKLRVNCGDTINCARHRRCGHPGALGDLTNVHNLLRVSPSVARRLQTRAAHARCPQSKCKRSEFQNPVPPPRPLTLSLLSFVPVHIPAQIARGRFVDGCCHGG